MKNNIFILFTIGLISLNIWFCKIKKIDKLEYSYYDIQLKLIPEKQFIGVDGSLKYLVNEDSLQKLTFNLHKNFEINLFSINGDISYYVDTIKTLRWLPDANKIIYKTDSKFNKGDVLNVEFSYQGKIDQWPSWSGNVISADWVEMGMYFPWYPSTHGKFNYKVSIDIDPEYNVFAEGRYSEKNKKKIFETNNPVNDFIICAAKDLTIRETVLFNKSIQIVNCTMSDSVVDSIQMDIENIYNYFSSSFGNIDVPSLSIVLSKREKGGGYSRKGGLYLGGISDSSYLKMRIDYIQYISHEISHFWWNEALNDWEDWLNESFAEYSSLSLIKELYSKDAFDAMIEKKKRKYKYSSNLGIIQK